MQGNLDVLTVSQLNEYVRRLLAGDPLLRSVKVMGEISGFKRHYSGHLYFSIKDEGARVQCVMFRQKAMGLTFEPRDGMRVVVYAAASLFPRDGAYQLYAESMRQEGAGELYLRFEALKKKLQDEGLFDPARKRPLPLWPRTIGVVTSRTGAVLRDICRVARRRNPHIDVLLCQASVQGPGAAAEIAGAIEDMNAWGKADVLLVGRGGGSMEDLWPFNEEIVARAIAASRIPVISCVGHETDFTIADFVADERAATPSVAAEIAVPDVKKAIYDVAESRGRMLDALTRRLMYEKARLSALTRSPALSDPERLMVGERRQMMQRLLMRMNAAMDKRMEAEKGRMTALNRALSGVSPRSVLSRGFAAVYVDGKPVYGVGNARVGDVAHVMLSDGTFDARIERTDRDEA